eukprot:TRINITY_DN320_c0_g1_i2.p1 TRINITY_DN320_c0_g1~~TRINITY_DN320_c0_g1_i2.p1  ORF type:complete len:804 (-),score=372.36 TRINITY_DN320_c0_g1_i2:808-3219(-)
MAAAVAVDPATAMASTSSSIAGPSRGATVGDMSDTLLARLSTTSTEEELARTLTGDVESLQRTADRQMGKLGVLNTSLNRKLRKLEADAAHLGGENANLRRAYINLLAELRAAQAAAAELAAKEAELATVTTNYDGARKNVRELKSRLKRVATDAKTVKAEKEAVDAKLAELTAAEEVKTREASEAVIAAAAERAALERDLETTRTQVTERAAALESVTDEQTRLEGEAASLTEQVETLTASLAAAKAAADEAESAKDDVTAKLAVAEERAATLEGEQKEAEELHASVEQSVNDLMAQVEAVQAAKAVAEAEAEATKTELERTTVIKDAVESSRADLADELQAVTAAKSDLETLLSAANAAKSAAADKATSVAAEKEEVNRSLAVTSADKSALEEEVERLRRQVRDMADAHDAAMLALVTEKEDEKAQLLAALERDVAGAIDKQKEGVSVSRRTSLAGLSARSAAPPTAVDPVPIAAAADDGPAAADDEPAAADDAAAEQAAPVDLGAGALGSSAGPRASVASSAYTEGTYEEEEPASMPMGADTVDDSEGATTPRTSSVSRAFDGAQVVEDEDDVEEEPEAKAAVAAAPGGTTVSFAPEATGDETDSASEEEEEVDEEEELDEGETAPAMVPVAVAVATATVDADGNIVGTTTDDRAAVEAELSEEGVRTAAQAEAEMTAEAALQAVSSEPVMVPMLGMPAPASPSSVVIDAPDGATAAATTDRGPGIDAAADAIAVKKGEAASAVAAADKAASKAAAAKDSTATSKTRGLSDASTATGPGAAAGGGRISGFFKSCGCFSSE